MRDTARDRAGGARRQASWPRASVTKSCSRSISYYANDLTVIGWNAAFLYDSTSGAETAIQLLEYANSQLLEFRHYDDMLTGELERVYTLLDEGRASWRDGGWRARLRGCTPCCSTWPS